jgi:chloride channel 7
MSTSVLWILTAAKSGLDSYDQLGPTFGTWDDAKKFELWELPFFGVIAVFGGFAGALFCECNLYLSHWRRKYTMGGKHKKILDALMCVFITSTVNFWLPYWFNVCTKEKSNFLCNDNQNKYNTCYGLYEASPSFNNQTLNGFVKSICTPPNVDPCCVEYSCDEGSHYEPYTCPKGYFNQAATMSFQFTEDTIQGFFHNHGSYSLTAMLAYFCCTFFVANITYGVAVPSGLFVPCILMGSAFGRFWGELVKTWFSNSVRPGVYALIGAAAMLSAVTRITITITVILFETTNQVFLIMPIMATVLIAKWIADVYNISLYDMHVELKCVPFVEPDPPNAMDGMLTGEIMTQNVVMVNEVATVKEIFEVLTSTTHNGFPVVSNNGSKYRGTIIRNHLIVLLRRQMWSGSEQEILAGTASPKPLLELEDFASSLESKNMSIDDMRGEILNIEQIYPNAAIDLRPYMNPAAIFVMPECPITRCFTLFRGMGIRHLPVVDDSVVVGIISRKELMTDFAQDLY